mgnify:CR=1 FL=1
MWVSEHGVYAMTEKTKPVVLDPMLPRVEKALVKSGLSATAFGYMYFGDPAIVKKMRNGRNLKGLRERMEKLFAELKV